MVSSREPRVSVRRDPPNGTRLTAIASHSHSHNRSIRSSGANGISRGRRTYNIFRTSGATTFSSSIAILLVPVLV